LIISHANRFIVMSPWKTASSTCHDTLESYNESSYDRFFQFNPSFNRVVHQHLTLAEVLALPEGKLGYKIGAFVRNPYDRAYSGFMQIQQDYQNQPNAAFSVSWIQDLVRQQISENMSRIIRSGFDFNEWIEILPDYEVFDVGRNTSMVLHPSHYWTHVNGEQFADFIGKVEDFENDFSRFCKLVKIEPPTIVRSNVGEPVENGWSGDAKYASRMSRRALDRINELFRADFELFGYERL
jgi:hypothetical protein